MSAVNVTVDSTHPSATVNLAVLLKTLDNMLTVARTGGSYQFTPDDYTLLWYLRYGNADGKTNTIGALTVNSITTNYGS